MSISLEGGRSSSGGLQEYLVLHGLARIEERGAPATLQRLARTYIGPEAKFPPMDSPPTGVVTRTTVQRIGGHGPWGPALLSGGKECAGFAGRSE